MEEVKGFFLKVFGVKHMFFQCLHSMGTCEQVHPGQGPILGFLLHTGGGSQADLVRQMQVSAATVAVSISRLEKLGLVTRERNQLNQRANVLSLTEEGRRAALQMQRDMDEVGQAALKDFSAQEREAMHAYCDRIIQNLQSHCKTKE